MQIINQIKGWWLRIPEAKRAKIVYEIGSIFNTFIAAFLLQAAVDIEASKFIISLDTMTLVSLLTACVRAGVKAVIQNFVLWIRSRFASKSI